MSGGEIRIFTYYWRIENFTESLRRNLSEIFSPVFSISGLHLRVKATLNHLNRDYLYLQVESVPLELIDDMSNIVLETGDLFKEIETKKLFRHKIAILDQVSCDTWFFKHRTRDSLKKQCNVTAKMIVFSVSQRAPTSDLISQEFFNTNSGFPVPNSAVSSEPFCKNDSVLIKIVIFL